MESKEKIDLGKIKKITENDAKEIAKLYEHYLNAGENIQNYILKGINDPLYTGFKAIDHNNHIIGFISGRNGIDFTYPHDDIKREIEQIFPNQKIYTTDAFVIKEEFRHEGIAKRLGEEYLEALKQKKISLILEELWIHPDGCIPAREALRHFGNILFCKKYDSFYKELEKYHMTCPICGEHCVCGAYIEIRDINSSILLEDAL